MTIAGVSRSTWHYRTNPRPRVADPIPHNKRAYPSCISSTDRGLIEKKITAGWALGHSIDHSFAETWDTGVMLAGRRSWWRVGAVIADQTARPMVPTKRVSKNPRAKPVLVATGPMQVWSWDITDLHTEWRNKAFKAYSIIDIWSRKIVGFRVEERESDHLAVEMFQAALAAHGIPNYVHADSGPAMRSTVLADLLADHNVEKTHNRPYVSNDNPFSESEFRTMKYRPNYPGIFESLTNARTHLDGYVAWYNTNHKHSGIALFSPQQAHDGSWQQAHAQRDITLQSYYRQHPERFRAQPTTPAPAGIVGINHLPEKTGTN
ncbi:integrase-like protein [Glaciihabitans tibetensis]|uniref:Integrase-like protein n=1 Tax=Glaciihabitans tibetensis TaxID=1266600 RepID=A0A2T0UZP6_9MICO|nr:DDE-type integrase/transposase/recombinase [Glaciihabitans tibetensis]PRY63405.1 integrase-like protein [Glaciihabitans tibetensis]